MKARVLIPLFFGMLYTIQCVWFIGTQSFTYDEPYHIVAGMEAWRHHRFDLWYHDPPLARLLFTLPIARGDWQIDQVEDMTATAFRPSPEAIAWRVRLVNVILGLVLAGLLWRTARQLFSEGAANLALALFAFSPALISNFSIATTDGAGTLMIFATAAQLAHWRRNPSRLGTAVLGLVLGGLLIAKSYSPPMFVLAIGLILVSKPEGVILRPREWNWRKATALFAIALVVVWSTYFFQISKVTLRDGQVTVTFPGTKTPVVKKMWTPVNLTFFLPAGAYVTGVVSAIRHSAGGHRSFFLGKVSERGAWRLYFPVVILLKWPTTVLLLFGVTVTLALRRLLRIPHDLQVMMLFSTVFFLLSVVSSIDIGDRHILPVYPFVLLFTAALWDFARRRRVVLVLIVAGILIHAADCLRYAPDDLSYFNPFVKPENSYQLLTDSNLDWGQGLIALRQYEVEHPNEKIYLAYFGNVTPSVYGIHVLPLREKERVTGTVIVSATDLSGQYLRGGPDGYRWVLQYPRKTILNHSLHVFDVSDKVASGS